MPTGLHRIAPLPALLALLLVTGACDSPRPAPPVERASRAPADAAPVPSPTITSMTGPAAIGPAPADLRDTDWAHVPVPGAFCDVPGLVRLDAAGEATATSRTWGPVRIMRGRTAYYGDSVGDTRDEAAIYLACDDGGRTQNQGIAVGYAVFGHAGGNLTVVGTITPQQVSSSYGTALTDVEFARGRITVREKFYRTGDAHCCPGGDATTVWTQVGRQLTPGDPRITS
ncbi:hypothetical protein [Streptomyces griseus]|uniref:hypothetical protein n=1 Tax=Streptomyces griseus TaxID=1911 RepID=UPI0008402CAC|nr:hypothetical protein [Streptomyces griseus]